MNADTLGTQLKDLQSKMAQYGSELPGQIKEEIRTAWSPSLKEAAGVTGQQLQNFLPSYFGMGDQLGGTTSADISPTARLQQMGNYLGELGGNLSSASNYGDYLGANMKSATQDALDAMNMGYGNLKDQYGNVFNQYSLAQQMAEAEKNRQLQRELAARSGGGGGGTIVIGGGGGNEAEGIQKLLSINRTGITAQDRYNLASAIIKQYPGIDLEAAYEAAGFSPYWNPALNPGKWSGGKQVVTSAYDEAAKRGRVAGPTFS